MLIYVASLPQQLQQKVNAGACSQASLEVCGIICTAEIGQNALGLVGILMRWLPAMPSYIRTRLMQSARPTTGRQQSLGVSAFRQPFPQQDSAPCPHSRSDAMETDMIAAQCIFPKQETCTVATVQIQVAWGVIVSGIFLVYGQMEDVKVFMFRPKTPIRTFRQEHCTPGRGGNGSKWAGQERRQTAGGGEP